MKSKNNFLNLNILAVNTKLLTIKTIETLTLFAKPNFFIIKYFHHISRDKEVTVLDHVCKGTPWNRNKK